MGDDVTCGGEPLSARRAACCLLHVVGLLFYLPPREAGRAAPPHAGGPVAPLKLRASFFNHLSSHTHYSETSVLAVALSYLQLGCSWRAVL